MESVSGAAVAFREAASVGAQAAEGDPAGVRVMESLSGKAGASREAAFKKASVGEGGSKEEGAKGVSATVKGETDGRDAEEEAFEVGEGSSTNLAFNRDFNSRF